MTWLLLRGLWDGFVGFLRLIPWQGWAAAGLAVGLWFFHGWAYDQGAASRDLEVATLRAERDEGVAANASLGVTITALEAANGRWAEAARVTQDEADRVTGQLKAYAERLQGELQRERRKRDVIYQGDSNAKAWADTAVPRAVVDSLLAEAGARPH